MKVRMNEKCKLKDESAARECLPSNRDKQQNAVGNDSPTLKCVFKCVQSRTRNGSVKIAQERNIMRSKYDQQLLFCNVQNTS